MSTKLIVLIAAVGGIALIILFFILYLTIFSKKRLKKQIKDVERRYSYLDALLIGQDSQYIHRLEIISHSNLLYVDKHEQFRKRFKDIYDNDDKYCESLIRQLNSLVAHKSYRNIKATLSDAKKAVAIFEESVNQLNDDLYQIIRLEEDSRSEILKLKESYRLVKQVYYTNSNDLELVSASVNKVFIKLDGVFQEYENHIERAEYDEAANLIPTIKNVIDALNKVFKELPNLCSLVMQVVPQKIEELNNHYLLLSRQNLPLYHLSILDAINRFKKEIATIKDGIVDLKVLGLTQKCEGIMKQIDILNECLNEEVEAKKYFIESKDPLYVKVKDLNDYFLKIIGILPNVRKIYVIDDEQEKRIEDLKENINKLWNTKRLLDGFLNSATQQPFSTLKEKLDNLSHDYDIASTSLKDFKAYLDSLKVSCEEAYSMVSIYYYRTKQVEHTLRLIALPDVTEVHNEAISAVYKLLCDIDAALKSKPINVATINELAEALKATANSLFENVEDAYRDSSLAESAIVYANRDRNHQTDVNQELSVLEQNFFQGEFEKVYEDANSIYRRTHVEDNGRAKR